MEGTGGDIPRATAYGTPMNTQPVRPSEEIVLEPAAVAGRAVIASDWYYYFMEARLVLREVADH